MLTAFHLTERQTFFHCRDARQQSRSFARRNPRLRRSPNSNRLCLRLSAMISQFFIRFRTIAPMIMSIRVRRAIAHPDPTAAYTSPLSHQVNVARRFAACPSKARGRCRRDLSDRVLRSRRDRSLHRAGFPLVAVVPTHFQGQRGMDTEWLREIDRWCRAAVANHRDFPQVLSPM